MLVEQLVLAALLEAQVQVAQVQVEQAVAVVCQDLPQLPTLHHRQWHLQYPLSRLSRWPPRLGLQSPLIYDPR